MAKLTTIFDVGILLELLPEIKKLAGSSASDPKILHSNAIRTAILKNNLVALVDEDSPKPVLAGYIWWNGIYPNANILQIAISKSFSRNEVSATLVKDISSYLQKLGFMTLQANLAEDESLPSNFYEENKFYPLKSNDSKVPHAGRTSIPYTRDLQSKILNTDMSLRLAQLRIQTSSSVDHPIYALDSSVYFDLASLNNLTLEANKLFSATSNNIIRLAIGQEYVLNLQKSNLESHDQNIFQMAQDLPRLTEAYPEDLNSLRDRIHNRLFVEHSPSNANAQRSTSCSKQIANAILNRALAFVTSNNEILGHRELLINEFGIDVISIDDLLQLVTERDERRTRTAQQVERFTISIPSQYEVSEYFTLNNVQESIIQEFSIESINEIDCWRRCFRVNGKICGVAILLTARKTDSTSKLTMYCDENNFHKGLFAEHLLNLSLKEASRNCVSNIEIEIPAKQPTLSALSRSKGFNTSIGESHNRKVAIGRPITEQQWPELVREILDRTGLILPSLMPKRLERFKIQTQSGHSAYLSQFEFEKLFCPTVIAWNDRDGVVVPIKPLFSKELLEETPPLSINFDLNAKYFSRRTYVSRASNASKMKPGSPIFFYESKGGNKGAGAILAVAQIISALVYPNFETIRELDGRLEVSKENTLRTRNVVVTSFDNFFRLHNPIPLDQLKGIGAADDSNLVSAKQISAEQVNKILEMGYDFD